MSKAPVIASFFIGAAVGSIGTYFAVRNKFQAFADEQIESVKEVFSKRAESTELDPEKEDGSRLKHEKTDSESPKVIIDPKGSKGDAAKPDFVTKEELEEILKESNDISEDSGYVDYSNKKEQIKEKVMQTEKPYVITPDEFGDIYEYEKLTLFYFADGVVTDSERQPLDDVDEIVGLDSLDHFGEYEDDAVYVRNDRLKADYEILKDLENYAE